MGLASAYYLTKAGNRVVLVEKTGIGAGASGSCDDMILLQSKKPGIALTLAMERLEIYKGLSQELAWEIGFETRGGMVLIEDTMQLQVMEDFVRQQAAYGLHVEIVDQKEVRKKQPHVSEKIIASTYSKTDSQVNPLRLMRAFLHHAVNRGMLLLHDSPIKIENNSHWVIETKERRIEAETLLFAAGAWTNELGKMIGLCIPIEPRRGQLAITEQLPPLGETNLWTAAYIASKLDKSLMPDKGPYAREIGLGFSFSQTFEGNYLLGSTRESAGFDKSTSSRAITTIINQARSYFPVLNNVRIIRTMAGFRPATPDVIPIVGPVDGYDGLFIAAGHEGDGIALSPVTGKAVAGMICGTLRDKRFDELNLRRFTP